MMRQRNQYGSVPRTEAGAPLLEWWNVESEPGIAVAGEDGRFDVTTQDEAETMAANLAEFTDEKLTVVWYGRTEHATYQAVRTVKKTEPW